MTLSMPPFHIGLVVADLAQGMDELTRVLGLTWAKVQRGSGLMDMRGDVKPMEVAFAYSLEGPPYLELIEQRPDSIYEHVGLHHIGAWTENSGAESERLDAEGWPREAVVVQPDGTWAGGLFHTSTDDLRIEVVDIGRSGPCLLNYLGGGDYRAPS